MNKEKLTVLYKKYEMKKDDNTESKIFGRAGEKERYIWNELSALV